MQSEANQHGAETPNALPSHTTNASSALKESITAIEQGAKEVLDDAKAGANAGDKGVIENVADKVKESLSSKETANLST